MMCIWRLTINKFTKKVFQHDIVHMYCMENYSLSEALCKTCTWGSLPSPREYTVPISTAKASCVVCVLWQVMKCCGSFRLALQWWSSCLDYDCSIPLAVKPPKITSQPTSQKDIIPGKAVAFSVQATGTEPLGYQWQWKQFGKKSEKDGWQNLSGGSGTFQVRSVKASHAGYYRCVVSNSAGSETSQHATLIVGKHNVQWL